MSVIVVTTRCEVGDVGPVTNAIQRITRAVRSGRDLLLTVSAQSGQSLTRLPHTTMTAAPSMESSLTAINASLA